MVTTFPIRNMLPLNLWNKQAMQAAPGGDPSSGSAAMLAQMPFGHPLATQPGFIPVSFGSPLFRSADHVPHAMYSYPAIHPSYFRPHLDPAALGNLLNPRAMVALHHGVDARADSHPSAFTPAKRMRIQYDDCQSPTDDVTSQHSPRDDAGSRDPDRDTSGSSNRTSPLTPLNRSSYSPTSSLGHHRANGDVTEPHYVNGAEDLRLKWKCDDSEGLRCPICKALLQQSEIRTHLYKEFTSLREELQSASLKTTNQVPRPSDVTDSSSKSRYDTFLRIRRNREARLGKLRGDRNKRKRYSDEISHNHVTEHEDMSRIDNMTSSRSLSPQRDAAEEETVDVTSCEDQDVVVMYSHPSVMTSSTCTTTSTTSLSATTLPTTSTTDVSPSEQQKDSAERCPVSRQSPYMDPPRIT